MIQFWQFSTGSEFLFLNYLLVLKWRSVSRSRVMYTDLTPSFPPPVVPPAEDVDRYRRRFNMRMLVPGRPVKESPATPPPVPTDRPTYREKFIPPELSMWDYFVAKVRRSSWDWRFITAPSWLSFLSQPFLPLSDSNALCDSDESGAEEDEDDDDAFLSDTQMTEHSDPNSYRYSSAAFVFLTMGSDFSIRVCLCFT